MSMPKKFVLVAVLVGATTRALASDASDDSGAAARQARETTLERRGAGGGEVEADARRNANTEPVGQGRSEPADCACRCAPNGPGFWTDPDAASSSGG